MYGTESPLQGWAFGPFEVVAVLLAEVVPDKIVAGYCAGLLGADVDIREMGPGGEEGEAKREEEQG